MTFLYPASRLCRGLAACAVPALLATALPASAAEDGIAIELNKVEDTGEGCRTLFVFENRTDHELSSFRVDLILFDPKGVFSRQLMLDMAPLYADKKSVASFVLDEDGCADIGSILVNDIPACANGIGAELDCVTLLDVRSRSDIPLEK
jgi:hypothetical protein